MSKAILILDIPDDLKKSHADITIYEDKGEHRIIKRIAELKPLPSKKEITVEMMWNSKYEAESLYYAGFNACIDEILEVKE